MPFKSKKQMRYLFANKPAMAKKWAVKTPSFKALPNKLGRLKKSKLASVIKAPKPKGIKKYGK